MQKEEVMYENYVFDLYGTLLDIRTNENNAYLWKKLSEIYRAYGADYTAGELKRTFRLLEQEIVRILPENGEPDLNQVFDRLFHCKGVECDSRLITHVAITFRSLSRKKLCVYEGVYEALQRLKDKGKGIYLLSNAQRDFTRPELTMTGLADYFDGILISSEVGYKKPAPEFFDQLFRTFGLKPEECLMIGNDEYSDIEGAIRAGMDSLYIHTAISPELEGESKADYAVMDGDWSKVAALLERL